MFNYKKRKRNHNFITECELISNYINFLLNCWLNSTLLTENHNKLQENMP